MSLASIMARDVVGLKRIERFTSLPVQPHGGRSRESGVGRHYLFHALKVMRRWRRRGQNGKLATSEHTMKLSFLLTKFSLALLLLIPLGLSCSSGSSDGGDDDDDDNTPSASQCSDTCEHVYDECGFALVASDGDDLSQDECEETCPDQTTTLIDCLEDVACTDAAINACLEGTEEDECDSDNDCATGEVCTNGTCVAEDECDSDFDCAADEECTAGTCVATENNLCGGQACATGCCQGSVCCGGVFCAGDCIGTPCCD